VLNPSRYFSVYRRLHLYIYVAKSDKFSIQCQSGRDIIFKR